MASTKSVLLRPSGAVIVEEIDRFSAGENFQIGARTGNRTLESIGWNFADNFSLKLETDIPKSSLQAWVLAYTAEDAWIKDEKATITPLAHVHHLLQLSEDGPCHVDGQSNFTYCASQRDGRVWGIHWFVNESGAWVVGATLVPHPYIDWKAGSRLIISTPVVDLVKVE